MIICKGSSLEVFDVLAVSVLASRLQRSPRSKDRCAEPTTSCQVRTRYVRAARYVRCTTLGADRRRIAPCAHSPHTSDVMGAAAAAMGAAAAAMGAAAILTAVVTAAAVTAVAAMYSLNRKELRYSNARFFSV